MTVSWDSTLVKLVESFKLQLQRNLVCLYVSVVNVEFRKTDYIAPIFDAIKTSSLEKLRLLGIGDVQLTKSYQCSMLEILKSNYTIQMAHISTFSGYERDSCKSEEQKEIEYYTTLNFYGRGLVKDLQTSLVEFVDKLAQIGPHRRSRKRQPHA